MKKTLTLFSMLLMCLLTFAQNPCPQVIPALQQWKGAKGTLALPAQGSIVINPSDETDGEIYDSDDFHPMPEGYAVISRECIARKDDVLHVALSSTAGGPPVIWTPVGSDTLSINGPLFCLR